MYYFLLYSFYYLITIILDCFLYVVYFLMIWIILWIVLFMFLVIIHELGHFFAAKKTGVQVLEFGLGIPPKVATLWKDKSGTEYTLNAIPLGGFVRLKGEDPSDPETFKAKDSFITASFLSKTLILLAWVTVNFLFAWGVLTFLFTRGMSPLMILPDNATDSTVHSYLTPTVSFLMERWLIDEWVIQEVVVQEVLPDSIASTIGIQENDTILAINNTPVNSLTLQKTLQSFIGEDIMIEVKRWDQLIPMTATCPSDNCLLWIAMPQQGVVNDVFFKFPLWQSATIALQELYSQGVMTLDRLWSLWASFFSGSGKEVQQELSWLSGPVWAVKFGDVLIERGMRAQFLAFGAMISFALAIFNILPIPALDGGRWLGVMIQSLLFRKRVEKYFAIEWYINFVFFVLLMALWVYIIFKDLVVAWGVKIPFIS